MRTLPSKRLHFYVCSVKVMRNILSSSLELLDSVPAALWFHFVENKQLNFSEIINEETFKALALHIIATRLILPPPHMAILECIFYFFDPKGSTSANSDIKGKEKLTDVFFFLTVAIISQVPFCLFPSTIILKTHTKSSAMPGNYVFSYYLLLY